MDEKLKKLTAAREKAEAKFRELKRKEQERASRISEQAHKNDTRRKILAGAWAFSEAEKDEGFNARMLQKLDRLWLVRDDDRRLFGLAPLSDDEKLRHPNAASLGRRRTAGASASAPLRDDADDAESTATAPVEEREIEAA